MKSGNTKLMYLHRTLVYNEPVIVYIHCCVFKPFLNGPREASRGLHHPEKERKTEMLHFIKLNKQCVNINTA